LLTTPTTIAPRSLLDDDNANRRATDTILAIDFGKYKSVDASRRE